MLISMTGFITSKTKMTYQQTGHCRTKKLPFQYCKWWLNIIPFWLFCQHFWTIRKVKKKVED